MRPTLWIRDQPAGNTITVADVCRFIKETLGELLIERNVVVGSIGNNRYVTGPIAITITLGQLQ
jgi:hypothetical protein